MQEGDEFGRHHFAARHRKLAMTFERADVALNPQVERRVREYELDAAGRQQLPVTCSVAGVAAQNPVVS